MSDIAIESEQSILAAMILHEDALVEALDLIDVEAFSERRHRLIFNAIIDVYRDANVIDLTLLETHLRDMGTLLEVGGVDYLMSMINEFPVSRGKLKAHANTLKEKQILRTLDRFGRIIQDKVKDGSKAKDLIAEAESGLIEISLQTKESKKADAGSIIAEIHEDFEYAKKGRRILTNPQIFGLSIPIPFYAPGHLWMIGAPSSHGKSTFLMQVLLDILKEGASVMVFSLEDSRKEKIQTMIANIAGVPRKRQIMGVLSPDEQRAVKAAEDQILTYPVLIYDDVRDLDQIRLKIKKEKLKAEVDIVAIDFVQNLRGDGEIYNRMAEAAVTLQDMTKELNVCMIALSQMTDDKLRGAQELFSAADIVVVLQLLAKLKKDKYVKPKSYEEQADINPRDLDLIIDKDRPFGETGLRKLRFSQNWTRIEPRYTGA